MKDFVNKQKIAEVCRANDIVFLAIFGSYISGELGNDSDIDLLVRFSKSKSLLELVKLEREFSELFGRKADLLTEASISPYLMGRISEKMEVFYEKAG